MRPLREGAAWGAPSGILLAAATLPVGTAPMAFVALVPLLRALGNGCPMREALLGGLTCGVIFIGVGFAWVPWIDGAGWQVPLYYALGAPYLGLFFGGFAAALAALRRHTTAAVTLAAAPGLWIGFELARSYGFFDVTWLQLGSLLGGWPSLVQIADLGGVPLISAWIVGVNAVIASLSLRLIRSTLLAPALAIVILLPVLYGMGADGSHGATQGEAPFRTAAVQPNARRGADDARSHFDAKLRTLFELSRREASKRPDLLAWPETAFDRPFGRRGDPLLGSISHALDTPLLTGVRRPPSAPAPAYRNSVALATPDGLAIPVGDKVRTIPLYEGAPSTRVGWALARAGLWSGRVEPARQPGIVRVPGRHGAPVPVGVLVCFDADDAALARQLRRRGARILVAIADEASIGGWAARQHALLTRLRAVENRVPLVRVANTGPSAWIDATGRLVAELEAGRAAADTVPLRLAGDVPLYTRVGDAPVIAGALVAPAVFGLAQLGVRRSSSGPRFRTRRLPSRRRVPSPTTDSLTT